MRGLADGKLSVKPSMMLHAQHQKMLSLTSESGGGGLPEHQLYKG